MGIIYSSEVSQETFIDNSDNNDNNDQTTDTQRPDLKSDDEDSLMTLTDDHINTFENNNTVESINKHIKRYALSDKTKLQLAHELLKVHTENSNMDLEHYKRTLFVTQQIIDAQTTTISELQHQNKMMSASLEKYKRMYHDKVSEND